MTPREAAIALNLIPGLGPVRIMRLLQVFASPELILESPSSLLMEIPGVGAQLACRISSWRSTVNPYRELELADNAGAAVTTVFDDSYPSSLRALPDPPIVLYSWGNWTGTDAERSIAVVGSRMATHYGRLCARNISMTWRKPESPSFPDWRAAWTRKPIPGPWTRRGAPSPLSEQDSTNCILGKTEIWRSALRTGMER